MAGFSNSRCIADALLLPTTAAPDAVFGPIGSIYINNNSFLQAYGTDNTFVGRIAGNYTLTGTGNVGLGTAALGSTTSASSNTAVGVDAGLSLTTGGSNTCIGNSAGDLLVSGTNNILVGAGAGSSYTTVESNNIAIGNLGVILDSGVINIGTLGDQTSCFIQGISGVTLTGTPVSVVVNADGQLGVAAGGGQPIETITGNDATPESPVAGNFNFLTQNASVKFLGTAGTETLNFGVNNLVLGASLQPTINSNANVGLGGNVLRAFLGTGGSDNNTGIGLNNLQALTVGTSNTTLGTNAGVTLTTGSGNVLLGVGVGTALAASATGNLFIGTALAGLSGDLNVTRIGSVYNAGTGFGQTSCYITGIQGVNVGSVATVVSINGDQLGQTTITAGTNVAITTGANSITISANATSYTENYTGITHASSPYSATASDYYIGADVTAGVITIYLPAAPVVGRALVVKDKAGLAGTSNITMTTLAGIVNIDGATTFVMNTNYESAQFIWNGTYWEIY